MLLTRGLPLLTQKQIATTKSFTYLRLLCDCKGPHFPQASLLKPAVWLLEQWCLALTNGLRAAGVAVPAAPGGALRSAARHGPPVVPQRPGTACHGVIACCKAPFKAVVLSVSLPDWECHTQCVQQLMPPELKLQGSIKTMPGLWTVSKLLQRFMLQVGS